jgi:hypothetical protein
LEINLLSKRPPANEQQHSSAIVSTTYIKIIVPISWMLLIWRPFMAKGGGAFVGVLVVVAVAVAEAVADAEAVGEL